MIPRAEKKQTQVTAPADRSPNPPHRAWVRAGLTAAGLLALAAGTGCEWNDWLYNPSIVGRWENTPTIVPVLERLDVIEHDSGDFVDVTPVTPEDLIPEPIDYVLVPGDVVRISILEFLEGGQAGIYERFIDARGYIDLPQLGRMYVQGLTRLAVQQAIADAIRDAGILDDPLVEVIVPGQRQATFTIFGNIAGVGRYAIQAPDHRLLDAIADAGGIPPTTKKVFVIRQVPLSETFKSGVGPRPEQRTPDISEPPPPPERQGETLEDIIRELTAPTEDESPPDQGHIGMAALAGDSIGGRRRATPMVNAAVLQDGSEPPIDLPDLDEPTEEQSGQPQVAPTAAAGANRRWIFLNGEWVQVMPRGEAAEEALPEAEDPLASAPQTEELVTQRIIEIPAQPLLQGVAQYNIVIRPGDRISIPSSDLGFYYISGPGIARPGVYSLPGAGRMTLKKAVIAAGGLSQIAIPERVDITRMVADDRQATIRLNLRAIYEGTHPEIFIKPDDEINIGTNFWATPLAIIRNGFRMTYGFGFLLDRNFGNDVFGAPPDSRFDN